MASAYVLVLFWFLLYLEQSETKESSKSPQEISGRRKRRGFELEAEAPSKKNVTHGQEQPTHCILKYQVAAKP